MSHEFDPDDNFGHAFAADADIDDEANGEALVWQLLLLINPGDEDAALQQFATYQEALVDAGDDADLAWLLRDAIDWKSGFCVADGAASELIEAIDELSSRWNLRIDWNLDEDEELGDMDATSLLHTAYDRLREHHYTLWTWDTGSDENAGWMTLQQDDDAMRAVASALGFQVRAGGA